MSLNRVVVTGLSAITPIGRDLESSWTNLVAGVSGIGPITQFDTTEHATSIAGEVKDFDPDAYGVPFKAAKRMDRFCQLAVAAGNLLFEHTGWTIPEDEEERVGCILGCGLGGLQTIETYHAKLLEQGPKRVSPFMIPVLISNMAPGQIAIFSKARGPNLVTTSACASGTHGIGTAYSEIRLGRADAMITGGVEATITPLAVAGFNALKALSTRNDDPAHASRPFDRDRDGFVIGEGCGLLLLESLDHAKARGATILAEVVGYGASSDAYHMTAPPEDGRGMALAMRAALREAGVAPEAVEHINAHATSTELNDSCETKAIKAVFGDHARKLAITANKSMIGHLLGAAGGVEAVFSVLSLSRGVLPGTINLDNPGEGCDLDYMADGSRERQVEYVLSNSFGFGGTNGCLLFKRYQD
ncbi:MAG: beta-ketoacyl-ACP synthase II [Desulfovibrionaceae bacterium]|jgi:3-oxoacyl-[acyl-carrier-protein] synthase II|nr:beta-ketoacyl-ACP synthase II [Desulfovibrionaceae bacterium]